ncbi:hypothetical protein [Desulforamulus ferrireducens]|uniref:Uncharacterized protein n=1 Tax=Desulforamulus ferrireducens TaxID=1833852 RepID=A0A1S6IZN7_9FIRM|nr:hypothetical protein [Desulforamulus ferrireducens]AQS60224.1 hypothetical protein B0537_14765 [Desulforamulus ferrireducens]
MEYSKSLKFSVVKIDEFEKPGNWEQICNLCGSIGATILPEIEYTNNKEIKTTCLSVLCASTECRNLSYHYFELDSQMSAGADISEFTTLPKGIKITCQECGNQNITVKLQLEESGFKYVHDIVQVTLACPCGNTATHQFLGKYF